MRGHSIVTHFRAPDEGSAAQRLLEMGVVEL
jgi:Fe2+ transport system protein FeoA